MFSLGYPKRSYNCISDDSISGFQFRYDIDTIFGKYRDIDIDIFKIISMLQAQEQDVNIEQVSTLHLDNKNVRVSG